MRRPLRAWEWATISAVTVLAAVLRLWSLGKVAPDPFYDAAVRSMGLSLHNFFFGAYEPGGSVAIDKPPVDLWLQVISTKALGFTTTTLKLPEALAGTASVPVVFAAVRRIWSPAAGIAAALSMAVLPIEVITARSDTMDAVMMLALAVALLWIVRASETGSTGWLLAGAAALGVAFNLKLLESFVALPGLAAFAIFGLPTPPRRRVLQAAAAAGVFIVVSLSWLTATLAVPASERPWAIGSSNGSAWNAAFVFNGTERLGGKSLEPSYSAYDPNRHYRQATQAERDRIPILPASATRLFTRIGPLDGQRLGLQALIALLLGLPALVWGALRDPLPDELPAPARPRPRRRPRRGGRDEDDTAAEGAGAAGAGEADADAFEAPGGGAAAAVADPPRARPAAEPAAAAEPGATVRVRRAAAVGLGVWLLTGLVLFSGMARLHPRYTEGFTPAVAAVLGIGLAWASNPRGRLRGVMLAVALLVTVVYGERLLYGTPAAWWVSVLGALVAFTLALVARLGGKRGSAGALAPAGVLAGLLVCVLAVPFGADVTAIEANTGDAGLVGALPVEEQRLVSEYTRAHQGDAYYQLAALSATQVGSLIVADARPILVLTTYAGRVYTTVPELEHQIALGRVRYAFLNSYCSHGIAPGNPACSAPARWIRAHGTDVSKEAGLTTPQVLWRLPGVSP